PPAHRCGTTPQDRPSGCSAGWQASLSVRRDAGAWPGTPAATRTIDSVCRIATRGGPDPDEDHSGVKPDRNLQTMLVGRPSPGATSSYVSSDMSARLLGPRRATGPAARWSLRSSGVYKLGTVMPA